MTDDRLRIELRRVLAEMNGVEHLAVDHPDRRAAAMESDWLVHLYQSRHQVLEGNMDRSWGILRLFMPLSLAPFAAVAVGSGLRTLDVLFLGAASVLLQLFAILHVRRIGTYNRWFWAWSAAIEAEVGLPERSVGLRHPSRPSFLRLNWMMLAATVVLWTALLAATAGGLLGGS